MATLRRSNGSSISSSNTEYTNRTIVHIGHGVMTSPGNSFADVTLKSANDALYLAASSGNPVITAVDNVHFTPRRYPET